MQGVKHVDGRGGRIVHGRRVAKSYKYPAKNRPRPARAPAAGARPPKDPACTANYNEVTTGFFHNAGRSSVEKYVEQWTG